MFQLWRSGLTGEEIDQMTYVDVIRFFMFGQYDRFVQEEYHKEEMKKRK